MVYFYFSPVYLVHILHHLPPQVFVQVRQTCEGPFQHFCVLCVQYRCDDGEEVREVGVKVHLEVPSQLNYKTESKSEVNMARWPVYFKGKTERNLLQKRLVSHVVLYWKVGLQTLHNGALVKHQHVERLTLAWHLSKKLRCRIDDWINTQTMQLCHIHYSNRQQCCNILNY